MRSENISEAVRYHIAVAVLSLTLSILIVYRSGSIAEQRRARAPRRGGRGASVAPEVRVCEMLVTPYSPIAGRVRLRAGTRLVWMTDAQLVPYEVFHDPYSQN